MFLSFRSIVCFTNEIECTPQEIDDSKRQKQIHDWGQYLIDDVIDECIWIHDATKSFLAHKNKTLKINGGGLDCQ